MTDIYKPSESSLFPGVPHAYGDVSRAFFVLHEYRYWSPGIARLTHNLRFRYHLGNEVFLIACFDLFLLHRNSKSLTQFNIIGISISS